MYYFPKRGRDKHRTPGSDSPLTPSQPVTSLSPAPVPRIVLGHTWPSHKAHVSPHDTYTSRRPLVKITEVKNTSSSVWVPGVRNNLNCSRFDWRKMTEAWPSVTRYVTEPPVIVSKYFYSREFKYFFLSAVTDIFLWWWHHLSNERVQCRNGSGDHNLLMSHLGLSL